MKYIQPEVTYIKLELANLVMGSPKEEGILDPGKGKGTDNGDGNIVMSKGGWPFGEEVGNEWPESKSLWDE